MALFLPSCVQFKIRVIYACCHFFVSSVVQSALDQIDSSDGTPILERSNRDYKISLGCITFGSLLPFFVISLFEIDFSNSPWFFYLCCTPVPTRALNMMVNRTLHHSELVRTRLYRVANKIMIASIASVILTLFCVCFKTMDNWPNRLCNIFLHVSWVLPNFPYHIEFWQVMTEHLNLRLVRNENEEAINNYQRTNLDDSDSTNESDDEQLPNIPTKIVISSEDLECNVCFLQYSDKRVPLVLKECGHSLCKKCCKAAQRQFSLSRFISCPFCRAQTAGPVAVLPKNYTVMGIVQKMRQANRE